MSIIEILPTEILTEITSFVPDRYNLSRTCTDFNEIVRNVFVLSGEKAFIYLSKHSHDDDHVKSSKSLIYHMKNAIPIGKYWTNDIVYHMAIHNKICKDISILNYLYNESETISYETFVTLIDKIAIAKSYVIEKIFPFYLNDYDKFKYLFENIKGSMSFKYFMTPNFYKKICSRDYQKVLREIYKCYPSLADYGLIEYPLMCIDQFECALERARYVKPHHITNHIQHDSNKAELVAKQGLYHLIEFDKLSYDVQKRIFTCIGPKINQIKLINGIKNGKLFIGLLEKNPNLIDCIDYKKVFLNMIQNNKKIEAYDKTSYHYNININDRYVFRDKNHEVIDKYIFPKLKLAGDIDFMIITAIKYADIWTVKKCLPYVKNKSEYIKYIENRHRGNGLISILYQDIYNLLVE